MAQKILVAEDDEMLRQLYSETLSEEGYAVDTAVDGENAYSKVKKGGWDLVLLDIIMPKMSGLEVVEKLRQEKIVDYSNKTVFLTNLDKDREIRRAEELGDGYIIKSQFNPGEFLSKVKSFL